MLIPCRKPMVMLAQKIALETDEVSGRAEHDQAQLAG
jgi:hypothetical protein